MECLLNFLDSSPIKTQEKALAIGSQLLTLVGGEWASIVPITFEQSSQISLAANFLTTTAQCSCRSQLKVGHVKTCPPRRRGVFLLVLSSN